MSIRHDFMKRPLQFGFFIFLFSMLTACDSGSRETHKNPAVEIVAGDECHLCGMYITQFSGPKGEAYVRGNPRALKFCSTRDLFSYILQPDVKTIAREIYVHDMGKTDLPELSMRASYFTDARSAYYVINTPLKGAMGHIIASFAKKQDAEAFITKFGGKLLRFEDITLETLRDIQQQPGGRVSASPGK